MPARKYGIRTRCGRGSRPPFLILPVFWYRHYVRDGGKFPGHMLDDLGLEGSDLAVRKVGVLPDVTLAGGLAVVLVAHFTFTL